MRERKIRETFDKLDEDGSGALDKDEVAAMAAALGAPLVESMGSIHLSSRKLDEAFAEMVLFVYVRPCAHQMCM